MSTDSININREGNECAMELRIGIGRERETAVVSFTFLIKYGGQKLFLWMFIVCVCVCGVLAVFHQDECCYVGSYWETETTKTWLLRFVFVYGCANNVYTCISSSWITGNVATTSYAMCSYTLMMTLSPVIVGAIMWLAAAAYIQMEFCYGKLARNAKSEWKNGVNHTHTQAHCSGLL